MESKELPECVSCTAAAVFNQKSHSTDNHTLFIFHVKFSIFSNCTASACDKSLIQVVNRSKLNVNYNTS